MTVCDTISQDEARAKFAASLSQMYQEEVPQYGTLLDLVSEINKRASKDSPTPQGGMSRLGVEQHGMIRLGTAQELAMTQQLFSIFGIQPVRYYNLTVAGLPVHATGFQPVTQHSLHYHPFRVFTSLLRLDLIKDETLRARAQDILHKRAIFSPRCVELIAQLENNPALPLRAANELIREALETFRWHETSTVDIETYKEFESKHPLIADIVCFRGPHINHLTPRVLDIDTAQAAMQSQGLQAKASIEGPPPRGNEILLRQTSFLALEESITFSGGAQEGGKHRAQFREIEQRGIALTPEVHRLYDQCLDLFHCAAVRLPRNASPEWKVAVLKTCFEELPDDVHEIRRAKLAYFRYDVVPGSERPAVVSGVDSLVEAGCVRFTPITYEDFLPASAAGIFQSNLCVDGVQNQPGLANKEGFETALGCSVLDEFDIYTKIEQLSIAVCLDAFKDVL